MITKLLVLDSLKKYLVKLLLKNKSLQKAKPYPVGEIRTWAGKRYKKVSKGKWRQVFTGESRGKQISIGRMVSLIKRASTMKELVQIVRENRERFETVEGKVDPVVKRLIQESKTKREEVAPKAKKATILFPVDLKKMKENPIPKDLENKWKKEGGVGNPEYQKWIKEHWEKEITEKITLESVINKEPVEIQKKVKPVKSPKKIQEVINKATPETRNEVQAELFGFDPEEKTELEVMKPYVYKPGKVYTEEFGELNDYTKVIPVNIHLANPKTILTTEKPSYIPEMDESYFKRGNYQVVAYKLNENQYYMTTGNEEVGAVVSLDVLAATQHYYFTKANEIYKKKLEAHTKKEVEEVKKKLEDNNNKRDYSYYQRIVEGKIKVKLYEKAPRVLPENKMSWIQATLYKEMGVDTNKRWTVQKELITEIKQKMSDMKIQYEDMLNTYSKGADTSYGDKGTKDDLLKSHGVLVKRQNGSEIKPEEIQQIDKTLSQIYEVFGDRKSMSSKFGLKISHSGDVRMHARKAVGLFSPTYHAIGVSAISGEKHFGFTLAHEFGHFMDYYLGHQKGYNYASDDYAGKTNEIAKEFRENMETAQLSDYQNGTCECFARALSQYYSHVTGFADDYQEESNSEGNHPTKEKFEEKIKPLIEKWFKENEELLKSIRLVIKVKGE